MAAASSSIRTATASSSLSAWMRCSAASSTRRVVAQRSTPATCLRLLSTSSALRKPHPSQPSTVPHMEAEPAVVKSPSDPPNPASWPGKQKSTRGSGSNSPFSQLGAGLDADAHQQQPAAESSKAAIEREQRSNAAKATASSQEDGACATLSTSSPAGPRTQQPTKGKETDTSSSSAPKAVAPEATASTTPSSPSPATSKPTSGRAFRAKKAALTLTPTAVERLRDLLESDQGPRLIRIGVKQKGCAGMSYHLEYITPQEKGKFDEQVKQDGVEVLIDSKALFSIIGSVMDWQEDSLSAKFVFDNPNVSASCGCGESWMV